MHFNRVEFYYACFISTESIQSLNLFVIYIERKRKRKMENRTVMKDMTK